MDRVTSAAMFAVMMACMLVVAVRSTAGEHVLDEQEIDIGHDVFKRATPPDSRYNNGYYNGVYDYYNQNNPLAYKSDYNNPGYYNPGYYNPDYYNNNRYYNRRSYPNYYGGSPYGPYNAGYHSRYYNNTGYPYGNYRGNYPSPYYNHQGYSPYNHLYNDKYYNQPYYQGELFNNAGAYNRNDDSGSTKSQ